jgi:A/G-specific adenine glycosylase
MLQQTTVEAVKSYFNAFVARWPTVSALAGAANDDIMKAWAGLGYYSRARNLKACADLVAAQGGIFPDTEEGLRTLPGIGPYTAAAISSIAFDRPAAVVDGNVERVVSRLFRIETPLPQAKTQIRALVEQMVPAKRPGDFAQATMDLGATICTPRRPKCMLCPLRGDCDALAAGDPELYPVKLAKPEKPLRRGAAFVAIRAAAQAAGKGVARRHDRGADQRLDRTAGRRDVARRRPLPLAMGARRADRPCVHAFRARTGHLSHPLRRQSGRPFLVAA